MTLHVMAPITQPDTADDRVRERVRVEREIHRISQRLVHLQEEQRQRVRAKREHWPGSERRQRERRRP